LDEAETRVVRIEEQIDVAVGPGLLSGDRAEQIQPGYPRPMKIGFVDAKGRDHVIAIHLPSPDPGNHHIVFKAAVQFPCGDRPSAATMMRATKEIRRARINDLAAVRAVLLRPAQDAGPRFPFSLPPA
jgi:hypothetical protein